MKDAAHITLVLDRSGSMSSIREQTVAAINKFIEEQKQVPKPATLTMIRFDDQYEVVHDAINLSDVPELTQEQFVPRHTTALLDAIGRSIDDTGKKLADMPEHERPNQVIFVVMTDGFENASTKYSTDRINEMIRTQRDTYQWTFVFLGANQDAIATASKLGIGARQAMTYAATNAGVNAAIGTTSKCLVDTRTSGAPMAYSDADRQNAMVDNT